MPFHKWHSWVENKLKKEYAAYMVPPEARSIRDEQAKTIGPAKRKRGHSKRA